MISVRGLSMRLTSGGRAVDVLSDVSLEVPAGQFLAIAGPSGSGKSTLLGLIAGLDQPTAGTIEVAGVSITALDEDALARFRRDHVGYVFQSFHLIPTLTAEENVAVPLEPGHDHQERGLARARRADQADRLALPYIQRDVLEDVHARGAAAEREVDARKHHGGRDGRTGDGLDRGIVHTPVAIPPRGGGKMAAGRDWM